MFRFLVGFLLVFALGSAVAGTSDQEMIYAADFDRNGIVGISDFLLFTDALGTALGDSNFDPRFDLDLDRSIGVPDFLIFVECFGETVTASPPSAPTGSSGSSSGTSDSPLLPMDVISICGRTEELRLEVLRLIGGAVSCDAVTERDLAAFNGRLDLSNLEIYSLRMGDFKGFENVEELILDNNRIVAVDYESFSGLTSVRKISLRHNGLASASAVADSLFFGLENLRIVDFRDNPGAPFPIPIALYREGVEFSSPEQPATLGASLPFSNFAYSGFKITLAFSNLAAGARRNIVIPLRETTGSVTFNDFTTEESGWGYRYSDDRSSLPILVTTRSTTRLHSHTEPDQGGVGYYGFETVMADSLCLYSSDCSRLISLLNR